MIPDLDFDFDNLLPLGATIVVVGVLFGMIGFATFVTNDAASPATTETVSTQTDWTDDFSADTSADYTSTGTGTDTWDTTNGVLNLTGTDLSAEISGETFGAGTYSMNASFKAASNPGSVMLFVART